MIPFLDLHKINASYREMFKKEFGSFLDKGWYILGDQVRLFEEEFATYCGTHFCIGTANGLDALHLILEGYKILGLLKEGDEVLVASNTYIATILGIKRAGLIPVLVEVNMDTYNFNFEHLEGTVSDKTKVVMPTHLYGQLADMEKISAFAKAHNLLIVDDCAQAHGAQDKEGNTSGSMADASGFSFYPTKNLGALGDAGAVTTNNKALAQVIRKLRNYGFEQRYVSKYVGINSRLDEIQAAFLRIKLKDLDRTNKRRQDIAVSYLKKIQNPQVIVPSWDGSKAHVFHLFVVRVQERERFMAHLKRNGITTSVHYPVPPHKQEALSEYKKQSFPVTEQIHRTVVSIPLNPVLTNEEVVQIIDTINAFV